MALPQPNLGSSLGAIATLVIWVLLALGVAAPVAVFSKSDLAGAVTGGLILGTGIAVVFWVARDDRELARKERARRERLDKHGRVVPALILESTQPQSGLVGVGEKHVVRIRIEATLEDGNVCRLSHHCLADLIEMPRLQPGCTVELRYEPDDVKNCEVSLPAFERAHSGPSQ